MKRAQVGKHLAACRAADDVLVMEAAWIPLTRKGAAPRSKDAGLDLRQVVLIGSGIHADKAAFVNAQTVTLPLHRQALRQAVWPVAAPAKHTSGSPHRLALGLNVLVAEDNRINARLACLLLDNLGCKVVVASDGKEAVAAFKKQAFDAVLMDCQMPVMDGHAATRKIRQWEARQGKNKARGRCKIIAMTASALPEERGRCIAAGMDEYLSKPFSAESLERLLVEIAQNAGSKDGTVGKATLTPVADPLAALTALIGEAEARALADIWLQETPGRHKRLTAALNRGQMEKARKELHALRGASSIFGLSEFVKICHSLETAVRNEKRFSGELLAEFEEYLQQAALALQRPTKAK